MRNRDPILLIMLVASVIWGALFANMVGVYWVKSSYPTIGAEQAIARAERLYWAATLLVYVPLMVFLVGAVVFKWVYPRREPDNRRLSLPGWPYYAPKVERGRCQFGFPWLFLLTLTVAVFMWMLGVWRDYTMQQQHQPARRLPASRFSRWPPSHLSPTPGEDTADLDRKAQSAAANSKQEKAR